ncbi:DUF3267 domain-containing protein [Pelomonas sp. APW6]|uniref:DUF3267 domain-containing protein n=1 Tax=Roseateles subflavus TaxID=3053353 RepID=A0ABT7LPE3_9BURK|nr:DUF3267 domain-containing protein [Pelomonas sp. APW6]MDL5034030.1 DUF3267 domain-containing protein [Pelomonas sp. APW6]
MRFLSTSPTALARADLATPDLADDVSQLMRHGSRLGLYGMLAGVLLWACLVFPELGLSPMLSRSPGGLAISALLWTLTPLLVCTLGHECLHLLALPARLRRPDTLLVFWRRHPVWMSTVFVKIGGPKTRGQFIWISVFPFLVLTVLPFGALMSGIWKPSLLVGVVAACNIYSSAVDLLQVYILVRRAPRDLVLH